MEQILERVKPKTYEMLYELAKEPIFCHDLAKAKIALNSVLHTFASQLDIDRGITVISNLPPHLKIHFSKGWAPFNEATCYATNNFINVLKNTEERFFNAFGADQIKSIIKSVFLILRRYIPSEKMKKVEACFGPELRNILDAKS
jgi:uncharacterized protein (DUF2267 family)